MRSNQSILQLILLLSGEYLCFVPETKIRHVGIADYQGDIEMASSEVQSSLLWTVLAINSGFFLIEMTTGLPSG